MGDPIDVVGGQSWRIRELFGRRFLVDPYQREYLWDTVHVQDLINDLTSHFLMSYKEYHEPHHVGSYEPYFLGPIVTHQRGSQTLIVDGQQRMTTFMLLLIWLHRLQGDREDAVKGLASLVVSDRLGKPEFVVEDLLEPRAPVLNALLQDQEINEDHLRSTSARNLVARFADIEDLFPIDLRDDELPCFIYFVLERITLVEITTHSDRLALETFETMNDRGLQLSNTDLLKSFILQKADSPDHALISQTWRTSVTNLAESDTSGPTAFMKNWLRAKYSRNATDDDAIGHAFDRWLRTNNEAVGLRFPGDFKSLVLHEMQPLSSFYIRLLEAAKRPHVRLDAVYYNGLNKVTLQLPLILAAVRPDDTAVAFEAKANMIAGFLDIVVARRIVNDHDYRYDSLASTVFSLAREIRNLDPTTLAAHLGSAIAQLPEGFEGITGYTLRHGNRARTKYLLSRMSAWLEVNCDPNPNPPTQAEAVQRLRAHEIEHLWANRPDYQPKVPARRFQAVRNRLGGLVLLTRDLNAAIGDARFEDKVKYYLPQNLLARSLHPQCYEASPRFLRLIETHKLPFQPFAGAFEEAGIEHRQSLYRRLCDLVWEPSQYGIIVPKSPARQALAQRTRSYFNVTVGQLIQRGLMPSGAHLVGSHKGTDYHAQVDAAGKFTVDTGEIFSSPSAAAAAVLERPSAAGWTFWRVILPDGTTATLDAIRKTALQKA